MQTTFVQLYRHWGRVRQETVNAYARQILVNRYLSDRRRSGRERITADVPELPLTTHHDPGDAIDMRRALAVLPPRQRALVVLRYLEDMSVADAALLLEVSEGTVKSQTARGIEKLRAAIGAAEPEGQQRG